MGSSSSYLVLQKKQSTKMLKHNKIKGSFIWLGYQPDKKKLNPQGNPTSKSKYLFM